MKLNVKANLKLNFNKIFSKFSTLSSFLWKTFDFCQNFSSVWAFFRSRQDLQEALFQSWPILNISKRQHRRRSGSMANPGITDRFLRFNPVSSLPDYSFTPTTPWPHPTLTQSPPQPHLPPLSQQHPPSSRCRATDSHHPGKQPQQDDSPS